MVRIVYKCLQYSTWFVFGRLAGIFPCALICNYYRRKLGQWPKLPCLPFEGPGSCLILKFQVRFVLHSYFAEVWQSQFAVDSLVSALLLCDASGSWGTFHASWPWLSTHLILSHVLFPIGKQDHYFLLSRVFVTSCQPFLFDDNVMIGDVSGGLCWSLILRMVLAKPCAAANDVRQIIVTLCDVQCQANWNVLPLESEIFFCNSLGVVATSLAQSQSAGTNMHKMGLRRLKFKITRW